MHIYLWTALRIVVFEKGIFALTPMRKLLSSLDSARDFRFASACGFDWFLDADFAEKRAKSTGFDGKKGILTVDFAD
jgi:hypothetical protein